MNTTQQLAEALASIMECSKSDAWNGSMALDDALQDARTALAAYEASTARSATETAPAGEHTRGPWIVEPVTLTISAPNPKGAHRPRVPVCYLQDTIHRAENARRIVACVNACEGIPTDALETMPLRDAVSGVWQTAYTGDPRHPLDGVRDHIARNPDAMDPV